MATRFDAMLEMFDEAQASSLRELKGTIINDEGKSKTGQPLGIFVRVDHDRRGLLIFQEANGQRGETIFIPQNAVKPLTDILKNLMGTAS